MSTQTSNSIVTITLKDLEKLIRRAVREEIAELMQNRAAFFSIEPDSPLYEDMTEIARMKKRGNVKIYSRKEAFGD